MQEQEGMSHTVRCVCPGPSLSLTCHGLVVGGPLVGLVDPVLARLLHGQLDEHLTTTCDRTSDVIYRCDCWMSYTRLTVV